MSGGGLFLIRTMLFAGVLTMRMAIMMLVMRSIFMLMSMIAVVGRFKIVQIIKLLGGHQSAMRISNPSEILGTWLDIQLLKHSIATANRLLL